MTELAKRRCKPLERGSPPLPREDLGPWLAQLGPGWRVVDGHHLERTWTFENFRDAMAFAVRCGMVAEAEDHHPDLWVAYGRVRVTLWTHDIDGLAENDFILAAKLDAL